MTGSPGPRLPKLDPALEFLQRLWALNHALERLSNRMEKRLGVTAQQRLLIRCVGASPGITPGQLATLLHLDPGTISASVARLEKRKLVVRRRDPEDSRRVTIALTKAGRALDVPTPGTVQAAVERLLDGASRAETKAVRSVLERFTALLLEETGP